MIYYLQASLRQSLVPVDIHVQVLAGLVLELALHVHIVHRISDILPKKNNVKYLYIQGVN